MSNEWKIDVDGVTKDFDTDFGFKVKSWPGTGHSPVANRATPYALQDGAFFTGQRMTARTFTLLGTFYGSTTLAAFHTQRQALIKALSSRTTTINNRPATVTITYTGAAVDKEIYVVYEGGLELATFENNIENDVPIRLTAYDPSWKATSDTVTALASSDTVTINRLAFSNDKIWEELSTGANGPVYAMVMASNGDVYIGGDFTLIGGVSVTNVAKWDGSVFTALGSTLSGQVRALAISANDVVYAGGTFTNYVNYWTGSAWLSIASGLTGTCHSLAFGVDGNLFAGCRTTSSFSTLWEWAGGASWASLGTLSGSGDDGLPLAMAVAPNGDLYVGGAFVIAGGVTTSDYIIMWDGSTFTAVGSGVGATVRALAIDAIGRLIVGGDFVTAGGISANYIAIFENNAWGTLGDGVNGSVHSLAFSNDGILVAGGTFTTAGGVEAIRLASYNGKAWESYPIVISATVATIVFGSTDNFYIGGSFSGASITQGDTTPAYAGTEISYPVITINRSGGTTANIASVVNTLTNATISMDYDLLDGETLTIDLRPGQRTVTSSFYGLRWNAILDNSDFASWFLQPDNTAGATDNTITAYVITTGSPTITTNMTYRTAYRSLD